MAGTGGGSSGLVVTNSTFAMNTAGYEGGGIHADDFETSSFASSTIVGNRAGSIGGGIYFWGSGELDNTIVAQNLMGDSLASDLNGTVNASYSLIESTNGATVFGPGNIIGMDPLLGSLQNNGGHTPTYALLDESPAINAGDPTLLAGIGGTPLYDQRGFALSRIVAGRIDIGAFEFGATSADFGSDGDVDGADFLAWQQGYGTIGGDTIGEGDANGDGQVDEADLTVWHNQYGSAPAELSTLVASSFQVRSNTIESSALSSVANWRLLQAHFDSAQRQSVAPEKMQLTEAIGREDFFAALSAFPNAASLRFEGFGADELTTNREDLFEEWSVDFEDEDELALALNG